MKYSDVDVARLAAYIDGEGCIAIRKHVNNKPGRTLIYRVVLTIDNTDPRLARWLKDTFKTGLIWVDPTQGPRRHVRFRWLVQGTPATELLEACMPYFVIKAGQAKIAIALRSMMRSRGPVKVSDEEKQIRESMFWEIRKERARYIVPTPEPVEGRKEKGYVIQ